MSVCLVVAFCESKRQGDQHLLYKQYMESQKKALLSPKKTKHNLAKIVFVIADDECKKINIIELDTFTLIKKPNKYLSFGSWEVAYNQYKNDYDYFIFSEDDYIFTLDNFDSIMVEQYKKYNKGLLVTWKSMPEEDVWESKEGISTIGIVSTKELNRIEFNLSKKCKEIYKNDDDTKMSINKHKAMKTFFSNFENIYAIQDYNMKYWDWRNAKVITMNNKCSSKNPKDLLVCYQHYSNYKPEEQTSKHEESIKNMVPKIVSHQNKKIGPISRSAARYEK